MLRLNKTEFNHVMVDLETLGTNHDSVILSAALVLFNLNGEIAISKEIHFDIDSCLENGLKVQGGTIKWWLEQSEDARFEITSPLKDRNSLELGLVEVENFIRRITEEYALPLDPLYFWGNSASFDLGILKNAFNVVDRKVPWQYWEEMDMRTLTELLPGQNVIFEGTPHNPLDDCFYQIKKLSTLLKDMGEVKEEK